MPQQPMYTGKVNSPQTELASAIDDTQTTITVLDGSALPDAPNLLVIGGGEDAETILYTGKSGNDLTGVTRGFQGVAKAWGAGVKVGRFFTAYDYDALRGNIEDHESRLSGAETEIDNLKSSVSNGKNEIASAITDMGQPANGGETFAQLAAHIRDISKDANAGVGDVLSGKTFYQGGVKRTGTMPNRGGIIITPGTTDQLIPLGFHDGTGKVVGDPDLVSANIRAGANIFGVAGKASVVDTADANAVASNLESGKTAYVNGIKITGTQPRISNSPRFVPTTYDVWQPNGIYDNGSGGGFIIAGDPDLIPQNIRAGVDIFGVIGSLVEGKPYATGTATATNDTLLFRAENDADILNRYITVSGLSFPNGIKLIYACLTSAQKR